MEVNRSVLLGCLLTAFFAGTANAGTPSSVTFSNHTSLSLGTSIAGLPGHGIDPSISKTVGYNLVNLGCSYSGKPENCPIDFTDKQTGAKVATVYINAKTATFTSEPTFYGSYASEYEVLGWDQSPISHIIISKKGGEVIA